MKKIPLLAYLLFLFYQVAFPQSALVPRQELFSDGGLAKISFSGDGQAIYYIQNSDTLNRIWVKTIQTNQNKSIHLPAPLDHMLMYDQERMLICTKSKEGNQLYFLRNNELSDPLLSSSSQNISIRQPTPEGTILILQNADSSGFYLLNTKGELSFLLPFDGFNQVFFDDRAIPVAAQRAEDDGRFGLYFRHDQKWEPFAHFNWNESRLIGGLQKITSVTKDGQHIYFTDNRNSDKNQLVRFNIAIRQFEVVAQPTTADILPFGMLLNDNHEVAIATSIYAKSQHHLVDRTFEEDLHFLQKNIKGDISFVDHSWEGDALLIREFTGYAQKYYHFDRNTKELTFLLSDRPHLDKYPLVGRHFFEWATSDSLTLPLHVYLPPNTDQDGDGIPNKALPTVLYIHGGPWVGIVHFNQWYHQRNFQLLANRGYAVVVCEFRGTTGLGKKVTQASYQKWGTDMMRDIAEIAQWASRKGIARQDKIGLWGWSFGGYATMAGLAFHPDLYACGIAMYGISDLVSFCKTDFANNSLWQNAVGNVHTQEGAALLRKHSPYYSAEKIKAPMLMTTGSKDDRVQQEQMDKMADRLTALGKDVYYFYYPEEGHDYQDKNSWISFWALSEQFLKKHLGGRAEPIGDDLKTANFSTIPPARQ